MGHVKLKDLKPAHVPSFYRDRLDAGLSSATVRKMHVVLHNALDQAVSDGLVARNVAKGVKLPQGGKKSDRSPRSKPASSSKPRATTVSKPFTCWPSPPG